ncbi:pentatricopeptide repeat-containing protein At2g28050 isoform X1 [Lycium ferocissimum]|uniref:pentatricopeptide repeat-containing protein At2g28050 isoform X1 n=1 Tax=Lycium ferocissimum TaxID=112874 RepID=UPI0028169BA0|nr:pentatricopeptide repeat-containing protein At2g28050 isoform X1 [Lycium ferocissimum]
MSVLKVLQNLRTLKKWQIPNPHLHPKAKIGDTIINTVLISNTPTTVLSNLNPNLVHLILSDPRIDTPKCLDFFNYLLLNQSLITFKIGVETHLNLVCRLVKERYFDDAENLLVLVPKIETFRCPFAVVASFFENHNVSSKFASKIFNLLLKALSDNGKFQEVMEIFMYMRLNAIEINERTCTVHLIKLLKSDRIALALVFFYQMIESGIQVSVFSLTVLVDGLCKNGEIKKARELVEEMLSKGVKPNIITCNTLVDACAKRWNFEEMDNVLALMNREHVDLNAETYKFLVDGFLSGGKIDDAERLILEMYVKGFKVDIHLYNSMIKGYCRLENTERALSLFRQMIEKDICPNIDTYSVLVKGLCDVGQVSRVKELVDKMVGQGVELDDSMFDVLIECYFKVGMIEEAVSVLALMEKRGFIADMSVYELIIDGLFKLDRTEEAVSWLTLLIKRGMSKQKLATIPLVDYLGNSAAEMLVHKRKQQEDSFDTSFYSDTISLWLGKQHDDAHSAEMMNISAVENEYIKGNAA